jgi:hypothetical protein
MSTNETTSGIMDPLGHVTGTAEPREIDDEEAELLAHVQAAAATVEIQTTAKPSNKPVQPSTVGLLEKQLDRKIDEEQLPVLGALVWWHFGGVKIKRDDLVKLVQAAGLDPKNVPTPEARGALSDAIRALKIKAHALRHKVDDKRFAVSINHSTVEEKGGPTVDVRTEADQIVEFNHDTKSLTFKNTYMEQEIRDGFQEYLQILQAEDLRTTVMRSLKASNAITVREKGGVYFVPRPALDMVAKLRALCNAIPSAGFFRLRIADEPEERADMLKTVSSEIEQELAEAEKDMLEIEEKIKAKKGSVRSDTLERRLKAWSEIKAKAMAYKDLLNFKAEDVTEKLNALSSRVELMIELA